MLIIFGDILMLDSIFLSLQMTWSMISNNKHGIYGLYHELPNNLKVTILGNYEIPGQSQSVMDL